MISGMKYRSKVQRWTASMMTWKEIRKIYIAYIRILIATDPIDNAWVPVSVTDFIKLINFVELAGNRDGTLNSSFSNFGNLYL